jgi:hypothetical protein
VRGRKLWISGWIRENEDDGSKWLKLAFREAEQRTEDRRSDPPQQPGRTNTYAAARGREPDRQQRPADGQTFRDDSIPFGPEVS